MSENEKQQRAAYQKKRKASITVRSVVIVVLSIVLILSIACARKLSNNAYVTYNEDGFVLYQAFLNPNEFYTEEHLDDNHAYVAELIDSIEAKFLYSMVADARSVEYDYSYYIDARIELSDRVSKAAIFDPVYELTAPQSGKSTEPKLNIQESVSIDFDKYNKLAREFVDTYDLTEVDSALIVTLHVSLDGSCPNIPEGQNNYDVSMRIPLNQTALKITTDTTVPPAEDKVLACNKVGGILMSVVCAAIGIADLLCIILLLAYVSRTRDKHINYSRRVSKILSAYKSYIQQIKTPLDTERYQLLYVTEFEALLEIRDTLQMPILMHENGDRTVTHFYLPTDTGLCYAYKVKVSGIVKED